MTSNSHIKRWLRCILPKRLRTVFISSRKLVADPANMTGFFIVLASDAFRISWPNNPFQNHVANLHINMVTHSLDDHNNKGLQCLRQRLSTEGKYSRTTDYTLNIATAASLLQKPAVKLFVQDYSSKNCVVSGL